MKKADVVIAALGFVFALGVAASGWGAQNRAHARHAAEATSPPALDQGRKWATDESLRAQMEELRDAMRYARGPIDKGRFTPDEYRALGQTVEYRLGRIVADCGLPPDADAHLLRVVADLAAAADVLQGYRPGQPQDSARRVAIALDDYGYRFEHPGWKRL